MTDVDLLQLMVAILPRQAQDDAEGDAATRSDTVVGFICFYLEESGYDDTKYYPVGRFLGSLFGGRLFFLSVLSGRIFVAVCL